MAEPLIDYYDLLDVGRDAAREEIEKRLDVCRREWTQRQNSPSREVQREAEDNLELVPAIQKALLGDHGARAEYDWKLQQQDQARPPSPQPPPPQQPWPTPQPWPPPRPPETLSRPGQSGWRRGVDTLWLVVRTLVLLCLISYVGLVAFSLSVALIDAERVPLLGRRGALLGSIVLIAVSVLSGVLFFWTLNRLWRPPPGCIVGVLGLAFGGVVVLTIPDFRGGVPDEYGFYVAVLAQSSLLFAWSLIAWWRSRRGRGG